MRRRLEYPLCIPVRPERSNHFLVRPPGEDGDGSGAHGKLTFDAHLAAFGVAVVPVFIPVSVHAETPCDPPEVIGKVDRNIFPVSVDHDTYKIVGPFFFIVPCKGYGECHGVSWNLAVASVRAVRAQRLHAADGVGELPADHLMFFAVGDHEFKELKEIPVLFQKAPVQPGDLVVLAVGVVVAEFRVAEFVAGEEHGRSPAAHQHGAGVSDHPVAE